MKRLLLAAALSACGACKQNSSDVAPVGSATTRTTISTPTSTSTGPGGRTPAAGATSVVAMDFIARFDDCVLGHQGILLDLGDPTSRASFGAKVGAPEAQGTERDGATWAKVTSRLITLDFVLDEEPDPNADTIVSARIRGGLAKSVTVYLDTKAIGTWTLVPGEARVVEVRAGSSITAGSNELKLRFNGNARTSDAPSAEGTRGGGSNRELAEIDWVHVGTADPDVQYAAPTRADSLVSATLGNIPRRALSLRAPGFARCAGALPPGGRLEASLGLAGATDGEAEVRMVRDRAAPITLGTYRLGPADTTAWKSIIVPLPDVPGEGTADLGAIELVSKSTTKGGRILFAEPRLIARARPEASPAPSHAGSPSRGVILVVLGDLAPRAISLYGGARALPELTQIAAAGVTFDAHRATTTLPAGALASMLTGLSPTAHRVADTDARLPKSLTTIADAARQGGVVAALFTANPTAGAGFGFDRGWNTFDALPMTGDTQAAEVFDHAAKWIDDHKSERFLVVVHARGGHPPWDATPDELKSLAPPNYTGTIDPKHAAELLSKARRTPPSLRFNDADRERMWALYGIAVSAHDAALGRLMAALHAAGRDTDTSVIVTGDVGVDEGSRVPFGDGDSLEEAAMRIPLVVRDPSSSTPSPLAGRHVTTPTSSVDVARSVLDALGLAPPASFGGIDLWDTANGRVEPDGRPLLSTLGDHFALRWGGFVLAGTANRGDPKLCSLSLEPVCITDVRATHPLAAEALHRRAYDELIAPEGAVPAREAATIDGPTATALKSWGR